MSLFENDHYRWRETYFILFDGQRQPTIPTVRKSLKSLGERFQITDERETPEGGFESLTIVSPQDFAGMDITYNTGEDVVIQVEQLVTELERGALTREERDKLKRIKEYTSRFEVFHFEQIVIGDDESEEDYLDP